MKINENLGNKIWFTRFSLLHLTTKENLDDIIKSSDDSDDSVKIANYFHENMRGETKT